MTTWVLLRGLGRHARHWGEFPGALQRHLPGPDVVVPLDLPGNGVRWRERSPATMAELVDAARRELATLPHRPPYVLVALSMGGMVALHWAAQERRKVAGVVLINSSLADHSAPWQRLRPSAAAVLLGLLRPGLSASERERRVLRLTSNLPVPEALVATWARHARELPLSRANLLRQLLAAAGARAPFARPAAPVLVLASARDRLVAPRCSQAIASAWNQPLALHPSAGHDLVLDDPEWVIQHVTGWWELLAR